VTQTSGLGRILRQTSARHGAEDWWTQRLTALALVPLTLWFCVSMLLTPAMNYFAVRAWMTRPWNTVLLVAFILVAAYHSYLGLRVVVEDYVHEAGMRIGRTLDMTRTCEELAEVAVNGFADTVAVDLLDEVTQGEDPERAGRQLRRTAVRGVGAGRLAPVGSVVTARDGTAQGQAPESRARASGRTD